MKLRLDREQPLGFLEFNYMILQAYTFLELHRRYNCVLQMGGSDQWGNIVNGIELARRTDQARCLVWTTNLLTTSSGAKMGKTAQGAVWLNADMLPVYDYWQFWRNTEDGDIGGLRLFTELPETEITRLANWKGRSLTMPKRCWRPKPPPCAMVAMRRKKPKPPPVKLSRAAAKRRPAQRVGRCGSTQYRHRTSGSLCASGLAGSNGEARRLVQGGGARINDERKTILPERSPNQISKMVLSSSAGKERHVLLVPRASRRSRLQPDHRPSQ